jgi:periplasmic divalent cation tolerance protein
MSRAVMVILVTGPDPETLSDLGRTVISERLAACVNVLGGVRSIYRWKGNVQEDAEALALVKTSRDRVRALEARLRELHPYEEPEFLAFEVSAAWPGRNDAKRERCPCA